MKNILYIFDFDDTLVKSDAEVVVTHRDNSITKLSSEEFAKYVPRTGDEFDFTEFESYPPNAQPISSTINKLNQAISSAGIKNVVILTARQKARPVQKFLNDQGLSPSPQVVAVGSANPATKARFVISKLRTNNYDTVHVFEDNINNIIAIKNVVRQAGLKFRSTLINESFHVSNFKTLQQFKVSRLNRSWRKN